MNTFNTTQTLSVMNNAEWGYDILVGLWVMLSLGLIVLGPFLVMGVCCGCGNVYDITKPREANEKIIKRHQESLAAFGMGYLAFWLACLVLITILRFQLVQTRMLLVLGMPK